MDVFVLVFIVSRIVLFFFFFQAEDGIRDFHVTGVQTWLFRSGGGAIAHPDRRRPRLLVEPPRPHPLGETGIDARGLKRLRDAVERRRLDITILALGDVARRLHQAADRIALVGGRAPQLGWVALATQHRVLYFAQPASGPEQLLDGIRLAQRELVDEPRGKRRPAKPAHLLGRGALSALAKIADELVPCPREPFRRLEVEAL